MYTLDYLIKEQGGHNFFHLVHEKENCRGAKNQKSISEAARY